MKKPLDRRVNVWYIIVMFKIYIKPTDPFTQAWQLSHTAKNIRDTLHMVGSIESRINHPPHAIKVVSDGEVIFDWSRLRPAHAHP